MKFKERVQNLKSKLSALFLAYKRPDTPFAAKIVAAVTVAYALSPIDLIPDFIPVLGYLDDLIILPMLIALSVKLVPKNIMEECMEQAKDLWKNGKPKHWKYAVPIFCLWIILLAFVLYKVLS